MNISGGISGTISDRVSLETQKHTIKYYEEIRHHTDDIEKNYLDWKWGHCPWQNILL